MYRLHSFTRAYIFPALYNIPQTFLILYDIYSLSYNLFEKSHLFQESRVKFVPENNRLVFHLVFGYKYSLCFRRHTRSYRFIPCVYVYDIACRLLLFFFVLRSVYVKRTVYVHMKCSNMGIPKEPVGR